MQPLTTSRTVFFSLMLLTILILSFKLNDKKRGPLKPRTSENFGLASYGGRILALRQLTLLPQVSPAQLERFAADQLTPTFKKLIPGVESYIIKGERGDNKGKYIHLLIFDSEQIRDLYFPNEGEGESGIPEAALKLWRPAQIMLLDSLPKYVKPLTAAKGYTDYIFME